MIQKKAFLLLFYCCIACLTFAQKYSLNASTDKFEDYLNEPYYIPSTGQYLLINYASPHGTFNPKRDFDKTTVTGFDKMLRKTFSVEVPELSKQVFLTGEMMNNQVVFFYADKDNVVYKAVMNPTNGAVSGIEKVLELNRKILNSLKSNVNGLSKSVSKDNTKFMIVLENREKKDDNQTYEIVVYDNPAKSIKKYTIRQDAASEDVESTNFKLTNEGKVFAISTIKKDKKSISPYEYLVQTAGSDGASSTTIAGLPEGMVNNINWIPQNNKLSFIGLLAKVKKGEYTHLVSGTFDLSEKKLSGLKEQALASVANIASATDYYTKNLKEDGIPIKSTLEYYVENPDKSSYIAFEENNTAHFGGFGSSSMYEGNDFFAANIYVVKLTPQNDIAWINVIGKNQGQMADNENINSVYLTDKKGDMHIFFNDDNERTEAQPNKKLFRILFNGKLKGVSLFSAYITADGKKVSKSVVQNYEGEEFYFPPHRIRNLQNENKIFYTPFRLRNSGNSEFKVGTLEIK